MTSAKLHFERIDSELLLPNHTFLAINVHRHLNDYDQVSFAVVD